jgi:hypothetical protein
MVAPIAAEQDLASAIQGRHFPDHPCFPQLKTACDPAVMAAVLRKHLNLNSLGDGFQIEACVPVRFRFRNSGSRCILQYALRLGGLDRSNSSVWVTSIIYADPNEAKIAYAEQSAADSLRTSSRHFLRSEALTFLPELGMLVQVFPHDRLVPNLPLIMAGPWPELEEKLLGSFGSARWQLEQQDIEPLRYLHGDGAVVRYTLTARNNLTSERQKKRFYAKVYRTRHGEEVFGLLQEAGKQAQFAGNRFSIVEPVTYCPERRCLVLHEAPGRSLQQVLLGPGDPLTATRSVARALAAFHQSGIPATRRRSAEEQINFLNRAAALLCWACPASAESIHGLVQQAETGLRDGPSVPIHWDLKSDHVFLEEDRVVFVDLDTVCLGDPARDAAHLAAHLGCRIDSPEMPSELAHAVCQTLIQEYFALVPHEWQKQFKLQHVIAILEAACGLFKRQEPRWAERAASAIDAAQGVFSTGRQAYS